jgi:hypothetical protein
VIWNNTTELSRSTCTRTTTTPGSQ